MRLVMAFLLMMLGTASAGALPRVDASRLVEPAEPIEVGFLGRRCKGVYIWQKYVPKRHPNYDMDYYDPYLGPPCRIGIYHGHGRGIVGTRVGDKPYRPLSRGYRYGKR